jgi:hypothetical protein
MPRTGAFENSFIALLAELWAELEAVLGATDAGDDGSPALRRRAELRAQALTLELILIADRCDSARWQSLMGAAQVERLRSVVTSMHVLLDFSPIEPDSARARGAIIRAQNFLFEELHRTMQTNSQQPLRMVPVTERISIKQFA